MEPLGRFWEDFGEGFAEGRSADAELVAFRRKDRAGGEPQRGGTFGRAGRGWLSGGTLVLAGELEARLAAFGRGGG